MQEPMKIAVAGATGTVGRYVVEILEEQGRQVVPIARSVAGPTFEEWLRGTR